MKTIGVPVGVGPGEAADASGSGARATTGVSARAGALGAGAEFRVPDPLALRAGFVYDPSPVPADTMGPELPDAHRFNYMVGAGYKVANWTIDGAFMYVDKFDRTVNNLSVAALTGFNGTWTGDAWLVGMDVVYHV